MRVEMLLGDSVIGIEDSDVESEAESESEPEGFAGFEDVDGGEGGVMSRSAISNYVLR